MTPPPIQPSGGFDDPRGRPDFLPAFYPKANGQEAPPLQATERHDRIVLEFLAAYYDLNRLYAGLLEVRQAPPSPERAGAERERLQAMEKVLIIRDELEDRYAPFGVIAEPVVENGLAVNLQFSFGDVDAAGRRRTDRYRLMAYLPIPLPEGMDIKDVPCRIEGPGIDPA